MLYRFNPRRTLALDDEDQWRRLLHHVTVEVLALAQAGRDISAVFNERPVRNKDWLRTARVQVKVTNGAAELQLPTGESLETILKAIPKSLAEEIIMAAENAEASKNSSKKKGKKAKKTVAEEIEDEYFDPKDTDAAEKATMRAIRSAIKLSSGTIYTTTQTNIGVARKLGESLPTAVDTGFLEASLADPTIKLSVRVTSIHNTETRANASTDPQARAAIDRQARTRPLNFICDHRVRPLRRSQDQARAREALRNRAAEGGEPDSAQRNRPRRQANTDSQAQGGWQMEGDRGGADQQRSSSHW